MNGKLKNVQIACQIYGKQSFHLKVKSEIVKHINENKSKFENLILSSTTSFYDYIKSMSLPGEWGTDTEIIAAPEFYKKNVKVFTLPKNGKYFMYQKNILSW